MTETNNSEPAYSAESVTVEPSGPPPDEGEGATISTTDDEDSIRLRDVTKLSLGGWLHVSGALAWCFVIAVLLETWVLEGNVYVFAMYAAACVGLVWSLSSVSDCLKEVNASAE